MGAVGSILLNCLNRLKGDGDSDEEDINIQSDCCNCGNKNYYLDELNKDEILFKG